MAHGACGNVLNIGWRRCGLRGLYSSYITKLEIGLLHDDHKTNITEYGEGV